MKLWTELGARFVESASWNYEPNLVLMMWSTQVGIMCWIWSFLSNSEVKRSLALRQQQLCFVHPWWYAKFEVQAFLALLHNNNNYPSAVRGDIRFWSTSSISFATSTTTIMKFYPVPVHWLKWQSWRQMNRVRQQHLWFYLKQERGGKGMVSSSCAGTKSQSNKFIIIPLRYACMCMYVSHVARCMLQVTLPVLRLVAVRKAWRGMNFWGWPEESRSGVVCRVLLCTVQYVHIYISRSFRSSY